MLKSTHNNDYLVFQKIIEILKDCPYQALLDFPHHSQLISGHISQYTTIEIATHFYEIDSAIYILATQFLWLPEENNPSLIQGMHNIMLPLSHHDSSLFYSGHCKSEFFYALPNNQITDDVFVRNDYAEQQNLEEAEWFDTTGLSPIEERDLVRYMRYEYGDLLTDEDGLKAHNLTFLGHFPMTQKIVKQLCLDTKAPPESLYIWHYYDNHYAYAYRDIAGVLRYEITDQCPIE